MSDEQTPPPQDHAQTGSARPVSAPSVYRSEIDSTLQDVALARFREILKGNGVKTEAASVEKFSGETLEFLAINKILLKTKVITKRQAGKVAATLVVSGPQDLQNAIKKEEVKITHSQDAITNIKDYILGRNDIGLYVENEKMRTPFLHKDFVYYEPCVPCHGKGSLICNRCNGKGSENCPRCYAAGAETCPVCGGRQFIQGANGQNQQCQRCNGMGKVPCSLCHQAKKIQCTQCKGQMTIRCQQCNGHKVISVLSYAEIDIEVNYGYDRALIPPNAVEKMDELGPKIRDHAKVNPLKLPEEQTGDVLTLPYHIKLPLADLEFKIDYGPGKEPTMIPCAMFGYQGLLMAAPPFLETIMMPGIKEIEAAAMQRGANVSALLQRAGRYKTLRLMILAAAKLPMKKAKPAVMQKIEIGVSEQGVEKLLELLYIALKKITVLPRIIGTVVGSAAGAGFLYYFFSDLKPMLAPTLKTPMLQNMSMGIALALALLCAYLGGVMLAENAKKRGLRALMPPKKSAQKKGRS